MRNSEPLLKIKMNIPAQRDYKSFFKYFRIVVLCLPVLIFVVATVVLAIQAASYGAKLHSLEEKETELETESKNLSEMMVSNTSLEELSAKSDEMGFVKPERIVYITGDKVVAQAQ